MSEFRKRLAGKLSGGMKQKLGLVCALIHHPNVILLGEPTTGVDPVSRRDFWGILYNLVAEGVAILTSTAYLDEAERCHRVALMHQGKLLFLETPARLKSGFPKGVLAILSSDARRMKEELGSRPRTFVEHYILPLLLMQPVRCIACFRRDYWLILTTVRKRSHADDENVKHIPRHAA